jgi:L-fuconolactonase
MRIDAHQHFWRHDPVRDAWITDDMAVLRRDFLPEELAEELTAAGMDGCVAVQADPSEDETRFLLEIAGRHAFVRGVVGWVDLCAKDVGERLEHFSHFKNLRGVRHIAQAEDDDYLARADVQRGIGLVGDFGFTYDILVYERQLPAALSLVEALPEHRFVVDHMAKPRIREGVLEPWASHMRELALHPHVWCKVSGMVTEADWAGWRADDMRPYLDVVFEAFGPERLMFGSDWPVCLLAGSYRDVRSLVESYVSGMPPEDRDAIFGGNAVRFYGLTPHGNEAR